MNPFKCLILLIIIVFASCNSGNKDQNANKKNAPVPVDVIIAANQEFPSSIEVNGNVLSEEMVELHPEVSGRITYLNIPDGASVKAAQASYESAAYQLINFQYAAKNAEIQLKQLIYQLRY